MKEPKAGKCQATPDKVPLSSLPHGVDFTVAGLRFTTGRVERRRRYGREEGR